MREVSAGPGGNGGSAPGEGGGERDLIDRDARVEGTGNCLASAVDLQLADHVEALAVQRARAQGWDGEQIAMALHTPRKRVRA